MLEIVKRKAIEASVLPVLDSAVGTEPLRASDRKALLVAREASSVYFQYR